MRGYKRQPLTQRDDCLPPRPTCWACLDTGVIQNSDCLVNAVLPDYDRTPNGVMVHGSDCALICTCDVAFPGMAPDGKIERGGYREQSGQIRRVGTDLGDRMVGVEPPAGLVGELCKIREQRWKAMATLTQSQRRMMVQAGLEDLRASAGSLFTPPGALRPDVVLSDSDYPDDN